MFTSLVYKWHLLNYVKEERVKDVCQSFLYSWANVAKEALTR